MYLNLTCRGPVVRSSSSAQTEARAHVELLLKTIGVSRIIVVDDEYAPVVEELIGILEVLSEAEAASIPHYADVIFGNDREIRAATVRKRWQDLDDAERRAALAQARALEREDAHPAVAVADGNVEVPVDTKAAQSLGDILGDIAGLEYVPLSLHGWKQREEEFLLSGEAANTVVLFDWDFSREQAGAQQEGAKLIREAQGRSVAYCGLITHTVASGVEHDAWISLAKEHDLARDRFVVIAKERLTSDAPDYYGFLSMLRLVVLSVRYAKVRSLAWCVFERSVAKAKAAVEKLSVLDFDRIVFRSSRVEGIWEPDNLFRVFGILMRRVAQGSLHGDQEIASAVASARAVSSMPDEIAAAIDSGEVSAEALRLQRFESYDSGDDDLNPFYVPIELGDIFETTSNGKKYVLLAQPCDLMVRGSGRARVRG